MTVLPVELCSDIGTPLYDLQGMCIMFVRNREREQNERSVSEKPISYVRCALVNCHDQCSLSRIHTTKQSSCTDISIDILSRLSKTMSGVMVDKKGNNSEDR
jgi:hypothetical protein